MATRLASISLSKYTLLIAVQLVVNVSLALWLYNEYLHNPYMQTYLSKAWSAGWLYFTAGIAAVAVIGLYAAYSRGVLPLMSSGDRPVSESQATLASAKLETIDECPYCEVPLRTISVGRLQCRNCRRYFKSSLPKVEALAA